MAMDGLNLHASVLEMQRAIVGGKIDKVQQPERDELLLGVHAGGGNFKLLLSASAANTGGKPGAAADVLHAAA